MKFGVIFIFVFKLLLIVTTCFAANENQENKKAMLLDSITVTADSIDEKFQTKDVDLTATPVFFSVISRESFDGKAESVAGIIEKEAGIQVRQFGGLGSFSTVSLRGSSSEQVMVFLDGILLNDASGGGVDLSNISLSDVESIEIYRGMAPVNFGRASVGGVVNIKTLRSEKGLKTSAVAGYGSFNTKKFAGFINHKPGKSDYLFSADYLGSDNDFEITNDNGTNWNSADDRTEDRNNSEFDRYNFLAKAGYDFTEYIRIDAANQWFKKKQGLPNWNNSSVNRACFDTTRNITTFKLTADDLGAYHLNTGTTLSYNWKEEEYDDKRGHIGLGEQHNTYTTTRTGADFFLEWLTDRHAVIFSADISHEKYEPEDHLKKKNPLDSSRNTFSFGIQDTLSFFEDKLLVTPAARYTIVEDKLKSQTSIWGTSLEGRKRNDDYISPQIGIKYRAYEWLAIKSNLAAYVREPSFFELFGDRGFFTGNDELKKEEGTNFDIGVQVELPLETKWFQKGSFDVAYFRSDVDELITRVYDARGTGKSVNISESLIYGVEARGTLDFYQYFRLIVNASWQDTENKNQIKAFDGKKLPGRFEKTLLTRIEAKYNNVKNFIEYSRESDMYYDTANLLKADDKEEINAGISWLFKSFLFSIEAKNIGDDSYEDFNGYPLPGRSFYAELKYDF